MPVDTAPPTVSTLSPADGARGISSVANVVLTFNEPIARGTGIVQLRVGSASGTLIESFNAANSPRVSISGATWTIDPTIDLLPNTQYYLTLPNGSIQDLAGNAYSGTSTYDFSTGSIVPIATGSYGGHFYEVYSERYV